MFNKLIFFFSVISVCFMLSIFNPINLFAKQKELHLFKIETSTEEEAEKIILRLKKGESFKKIFDDNTDMGYINLDDLKEAYKKALKGLSKGNYTRIIPINSKYIILYIAEVRWSDKAKNAKIKKEDTSFGACVSIAVKCYKKCEKHYDNQSDNVDLKTCKTACSNDENACEYNSKEAVEERSRQRKRQEAEYSSKDCVPIYGNCFKRCKERYYTQSDNIAFAGCSTKCRDDANACVYNSKDASEQRSRQRQQQEEFQRGYDAR